MFILHRKSAARGGSTPAGGAAHGKPKPTVTGRTRFGGNPYLFMGRRPFREARLRSYIVNQHRAGRPLSAILADPYVSRCGSESFCWRVLEDPRTIEALERDVCEAIGRCVPRH